MTLRSLLLAGTVLPIALAFSGAATAQVPSTQAGWVLAQADAPPCPEGQECPPPVEGSGATGGGEPAAEPPPAPPEPDPNATPPVEPPPAEAAEPPPAEVVEPPPAEAVEPPPAEAVEPPPPEATEPPPAEPPPAEVVEPPAPEAVEPPPAEVVEPPPTFDQAEPPAQDQVEPPPEQAEPPPAEAPPVDQGGQPPAADGALQPEPVPPAPDLAVEPPTVPADQPPAVGGGVAPLPEDTQTTVEQQLEAQGDSEEANRVRTLRDSLLEQFQQSIAPAPGEPPGVPGEPGRGFEGWQDNENVVEQRGNDIIIDLGGGQIYVQPVVPDDADRLLYDADNVEVQQLRGGRTRTIVYRRNGVQIITTRDRRGDIVRRVKRMPDGVDIVLYDNRFDEDDTRERRPVILRDVRRPRIDIPDDEYIVDLGRADPDQIRGALLAPPVQEVERRYTLDEVLRNEPVRAYSPRIDLDSITFETGSATIGDDQMRSLFYLGQAMEEVLGEHPDEVYLIEGHTDAVGRDYDNLILSDRRAEAVAVALSQNFEIPPENLVTQGYGEQYLKIDTDDPERRNRRATVRRLTGLLEQAQN